MVVIEILFFIFFSLAARENIAGPTEQEAAPTQKPQKYGYADELPEGSIDGYFYLLLFKRTTIFIQL